LLRPGTHTDDIWFGERKGIQPNFQ